ncbi:MAG: hypothetical protein KAW12_20590 [Candidatus Aminicenantes bacterium]|nr:hypothetical protein [Candidatus Aminicenantes bacterium]
MKIKLTIIFILVFSAFMLPREPGEIVKKCITTLGGEAALSQYNDFSGTGTSTMKINWYREFSGKFKIIRKGRKSWTKSDLDFGSRTLAMIESFDGRTAWTDRFNTVTDKPALDFESDLRHTVTVLLDKQAVFTTAKDAEIDGRAAAGIEANVKGRKTLFFIDKEDYTILEIVFKDTYFNADRVKEEMEKRIRYSDYKKFAGVLFPTGAVIYKKGKKQIEYHLEKVTFKPTVPGSQFLRPEEEIDFRYYEEKFF